MKIHFFQPPERLRVGGLDAAIRGMARALENAGARVEIDGTLNAPDCVHFHGLWQPLHVRLARECRRRQVPHVVSPHGMLEPWAWQHKVWKKLPYFLLVERRYLARANALLATSEMEAARLRKLFPQQRIEVIPLGLTGDAKPNYEAARTELNWSADELVLLFLSRVHPKKGLDLLLNGLCGAPEKSRTRLVIVGGGDSGYIAGLKRFCAAHPRDLPRIDWIGECWGESRWKFFQGADLFCLPSHSENFGLAVLEASQAGTPSLVTDKTPWVSLLGSRCFAAQPNEESVRRALERFFAQGGFSDAQREELAAWTWSRFDWSVLGRRYRDFYDSVTRRSTSGTCSSSNPASRHPRS